MKQKKTLYEFIITGQKNLEFLKQTITSIHFLPILTLLPNGYFRLIRSITLKKGIDDVSVAPIAYTTG